MKAFKLLALIGLLAMNLGLAGCTTNLIKGTVSDLQNPPTKTVQEQDDLAGFVINPDDKLIMLGQRYVYVFDDNESVERLKQMLTNPEFLKLKYHWEIANGMSDEERHKITYYRDGSFNFSAMFWYKYDNAQELSEFQRAGLARHDDYNPTDNGFEIIPDFTGKVYQHNSSTKALLKTAKPLSKPYSFHIDRQISNKTKSIGQALLLPLALPFTIAGDILILPVSLPITLNGGNIDWH